MSVSHKSGCWEVGDQGARRSVLGVNPLPGSVLGVNPLPGLQMAPVFLCAHMASLLWR